jgi:hypothetical protein
LRDTATAHAAERYLTLSDEAASALGPDASLEALAAGFARPRMHALAVGGRDLDVMPISPGLESIRHGAGFWF